MVPNFVFEAFEEVRQSGLTNMYDATEVLRLMYQNDAHEAVGWLILPATRKVNMNRYTAVLREYSTWRG